MPMPASEHSQSLVLSSSEQSELIRIASLYRDAKMIILYAEEVDPTISANIQIVKELRDALDHLMRLFINKTIPNCENEAYGLAQIDKAIGHVYRAAFDALDGTVLSLKIRINDCLKRYDLDVIKEVLPNYWEIKKILNKLTTQISENRSKKDVEKNHADLFDKYVLEVEALKNAYDEILEAGKTLDECQKKFTQNSRSIIKRNILSAVAGGLIVALIIQGLKYMHVIFPEDSSKSSAPMSIPQKKPIP